MEALIATKASGKSLWSHRTLCLLCPDPLLLSYDDGHNPVQCSTLYLDGVLDDLLFSSLSSSFAIEAFSLRKESWALSNDDVSA